MNRQERDRVMATLVAASDQLDAGAREAVRAWSEETVRAIVATLESAVSTRDDPADAWPAIAMLAMAALTRYLNEDRGETTDL
jgi:hypothetical protein